LTLVPHAPVTGCWDEFRVEQVIVNLLTNALRYGCGQPVQVIKQGQRSTYFCKRCQK